MLGQVSMREPQNRWKVGYFGFEVLFLKNAKNAEKQCDLRKGACNSHNYMVEFLKFGQLFKRKEVRIDEGVSDIGRWECISRNKHWIDQGGDL